MEPESWLPRYPTKRCYGRNWVLLSWGAGRVLEVNTMTWWRSGFCFFCFIFGPEGNDMNDTVSFKRDIWWYLTFLLGEIDGVLRVEHVSTTFRKVSLLRWILQLDTQDEETCCQMSWPLAAFFSVVVLGECSRPWKAVERTFEFVYFLFYLYIKNININIIY